MTTTSRYLEAPRRLRAFVRAHEISLIVLAALIGSVGGVVVAAMSIAVAALHALLFDISIYERLSAQPSLRAVARSAGSDAGRVAAGVGVPVARAMAAGA